MRVAVSDYDGTLNQGGHISQKTIAALHIWRQGGNVFGLATGRDLSMILPELSKWHIPVDFLICCNGAAIYGPHRQLLESANIGDTLVPDILGHPAAKASMHLELCRNGEVFLHAQSPDSWFPGLGTPYEDIGYGEALELRGLQQISLAYATAGECKEQAAALNADFGSAIDAQHNGACLDITAGGVTKATGVERLLQYTGWPENGLLAIGDGGNDLPLFERFGGYTVTGAKKDVQSKARAVYPDVGVMLLEQMGADRFARPFFSGMAD